MAASNNDNNGSNNNEESDSTNQKDLKIYVNEDSEANLDNLFRHVLSNESPLCIPLRLRKLPDSFFNPPASGSKSPSVSVSHSRENSADSAFGSTNTVLGAPPAIGNGGLPIHHSRAHSSPASLGKINIGGLGLNNCNLGNTNNNVTGAAGAGLGGATGATGGIGGKPLNYAVAAQSNNRVLNIAHQRGRSYDVSNLSMQLPPGWEQARTPDGRIYYIK